MAISTLYSHCSTVFHEIINRLSRLRAQQLDTNSEGFSEELLNYFRRSCDTLVLWNHSFGASKGYLDHVVAEPSVERLLRGIAGTLIQRLSVIPELQSHYDNDQLEKSLQELRQIVASSREKDLLENDDSTYNYASDHLYELIPSDVEADSLSEMAKDLETAVECLMDLAPLYHQTAGYGSSTTNQDKEAQSVDVERSAELSESVENLNVSHDQLSNRLQTLLATRARISGRLGLQGPPVPDLRSPEQASAQSTSLQSQLVTSLPATLAASSAQLTHDKYPSYGHTSYGSTSMVSGRRNRSKPENTVDFVSTTKPWGSAGNDYAQQSQPGPSSAHRISEGPSQAYPLQPSPIQPPVSRPAPDLWCEFFELKKCPAAFQFNEEAAWIEHHVLHFEEALPHQSNCWFCDDFRFVAKSPGELYPRFYDRMQHIYSHIYTDRMTIQNVRPDFHIIEHMYRKCLISNQTYRIAMAFDELPPEYRIPGVPGAAPASSNRTKMPMDNGNSSMASENFKFLQTLSPIQSHEMPGGYNKGMRSSGASKMHISSPSEGKGPNVEADFSDLWSLEISSQERATNIAGKEIDIKGNSKDVETEEEGIQWDKIPYLEFEDWDDLD